jgi:hypothetical protein
MNRHAAAARALAACLVLAGCTAPVESPAATSGAPSGSAPASGPAGSGPGASEAGAVEIPATTVSAKLDIGYKVEDGRNVDFEPDELPVAPGSAEARWYRGATNLVVVYAAPDLGAEPICPGNSIETAEGFEHVSNSPTDEGACEGAPTLADDPAGVRVCEGLLVYETVIPVDSDGSLFASLERYEGGTITGVTGAAAYSSGAAVPQLDADAPAYRFAAGSFPTLGEEVDEVSCS